MALTLTNSQTNDSKILYLTDGSTWGSDSVPALASVVSASLSISYKTPDLTDYTDPIVIDVISIFTAAAGDASLLIFPLVFGSEPSLDASAVGINEFPDGIWKIEYTISDGSEISINIELLLDMQIKNVIYSKLASVPVKYLSANNYYTKPIDDILLEKCLYDSMTADAYVAKKDEILNTLEVLQRLTQ